MSLIQRLGACGVAATILCASLTSASDPWAAPAGYYDSATGAGATLKSQLSSIMSSGHIQRAYGDFRSSAAIHDADPNAGGRILLSYDRASVSATWDGGGTWNREHVWPQSLQPGSASNSTTGNLGDPHALRPCNPSINSSRSNKPFGFGSTTGGFGSLGSYYFPGDADKGDIARSLFYSDTRWGPSLGIALVNGFPGSNQMGDLASKVEWHYLDPPDEFERRRNHAIYSSSMNPLYYTNNRNAFIDRPELVWSVYKDQQNDSRLRIAGTNEPGGGSSTTIILGPVEVGSTTAPTAMVTIEKLGNDGTYFDVTTTGVATSSINGSLNAFPIIISGLDQRTLVVSVDPSELATAGVKTGEIIIDNLDVTTQGGAGRGANDAPDIIYVELVVAPACPADINGDGAVNSGDLSTMLGFWGDTSFGPADLNADGVVNSADLSELLGAWGPC